jgi:hypothetical protein
MYPALRNAAKKWTMPIKDWGLLSTSLQCFFADGFRSYKVYLHKTIDRLLKPFATNQFYPAGRSSDPVHASFVSLL